MVSHDGTEHLNGHDSFEAVLALVVRCEDLGEILDAFHGNGVKEGYAQLALSHIERNAFQHALCGFS